MTPFLWPSWAIMWALAVAIFAACKWLTWRRTPASGSPAWRHVAYWLAWPGLDAAAFLDPRPLPREHRPTLGEWAFAAGKFLFGVALTWGVVRLVPADRSLARGWVGLVGLAFLLHFGSFHLLSCAWRAVGVNAKPLMDWPVLSDSVSEFWGRRWNRAFRDFAYRFLFRPLAGRLGPQRGLVVGFLFSGIVHDLVISVPAGGGYGWPTFYFMIQSLGLLVERSQTGKRIGLGAGWPGWAFTGLITAGPAFGLFHPPFVRYVILPFLDVIGAT